MTKFNPFTKHLLGISASLILLLSLNACSKKIAFENSAIVPAARGTVKVTKNKNNNYVIDISIVNLAESNRLMPPKATYVVWMLSVNTVMRNLGQIKSSTERFSKNLTASFETIAPAKPTKVFITAEDDGNVQFPNSVIVLTTSDF